MFGVMIEKVNGEVLANDRDDRWSDGNEDNESGSMNEDKRVNSSHISNFVS